MAIIEKYILALNAGSSSLKASLMEAVVNDDGSSASKEIVHFLGERLTTASGVVHLPNNQSIQQPNMTHEQALSHVIEYLRQQNMLHQLIAIGHRVVHGGTIFTTSVKVEEKQLQQIKDVSHLAPLHNPHNVAGIETMKKLLAGQNIPNIAVFDTSFHSTIPPVAYTYPLPQEYRDNQMRKFGFHGTSVHYVTLEATRRLQQQPQQQQQTPNNSKTLNLIVCHLGNGASVTAVSNGRSVETSMGFTPLSGLMMGTRCGSVDPSLIQFACQSLNKTVEEVTHDMNKNSGIKAMNHGDSDMRSLMDRASADSGSDDAEEAQLAIDMFVYRLTQHIASSMIALESGPLDAIVFTAGIGEHSTVIRQKACSQLSQCLLPKLVLDPTRNNQHGKGTNGIVSKEGSQPTVLVIPTDEEQMIAKECMRLVSSE